jgi:hypothetical protein
MGGKAWRPATRSDGSGVGAAVRRDRPPGFQIREAVTLAVDNLVMVDDEERGARMLRHVHIGKDDIDSLNNSRTQVHGGGYHTVPGISIQYGAVV